MGKRQVIAAVILVVMEPLDDSQIERVLVVTAHPDDCDFAAAGTIALWTAKGIKVSYCICTNGDQGGEDPTVPRDEMPKIRQKEQRDAGVAVGVTDITFLNYRDGWLEPTIELRKDIVRQIRISKRRGLTACSPGLRRRAISRMPQEDRNKADESILERDDRRWNHTKV